jgi:hypothetical protein
MANALDLLQLKCTYTVDRQDGRAPKVFEGSAFPLWDGLCKLLDTYYPGWVTCEYEIRDICEKGKVNHNVGCKS